MPKFEIQMNGQTFEVDAPDEQALQGAIGKLKDQFPAPGPSAKEEFDKLPILQQFGQAGSDVLRLASNGLTFGMRDKLAGWVTGTGADAQRAETQKASERAGSAAIPSEILGSVVGGGLLAKAGATSAPLVEKGVEAVGNYAGPFVQKMAGIAAPAISGAIDSLGMNALSNFGHDKPLMENAGMATAIGAGAPVLTSGISKGIDLTKALFGYGNQPRAYGAVNKAIRRSGRTPQQIQDMIDNASADGQDMYMLADATGHAGQRMLSGVARSPGDSRQGIAEKLMDRQAGQGNRISQFLAEGFDAPDTAMQRASTLTSARKSTADAAYQAARQNAGPVNLNDTLDVIDGLLKRDPILGETALSQGPMGQRLMALRDRLQKGGEQLVDFNEVLNIKSDLYNQMKKNPDVASEMRGVYDKLDGALENSSQGYRSANDGYRAASKEIDAVDLGSAATSGRVRSQDSIPQFQAMPPGQQSAFRAGYADPLIAKVEASPLSTNKARPLMTAKTGEEFPEFAAPGKGDQLGNRIARENTMFQTQAKVLGGSSTADNLADQADVGMLDPAMISSALNGGVKGMIIQALTGAANAAKGHNEGTRDLIAKALMSGGPDAVRAITSAVQAGAKSTAVKKAVARAMISGSIPMMGHN